ncbi:SpoIVB peptidase S55 domain-containing protein [Thermodesulfitimonas sp.]
MVGAVTHVFISTPEKGYGIFAERMARACGLLVFPETKATFFDKFGPSLLKAVVKY